MPEVLERWQDHLKEPIKTGFIFAMDQIWSLTAIKEYCLSREHYSAEKVADELITMRRRDDKYETRGLIDLCGGLWGCAANGPVTFGGRMYLSIHEAILESASEILGDELAGTAFRITKRRVPKSPKASKVDRDEIEFISALNSLTVADVARDMPSIRKRLLASWCRWDEVNYHELCVRIQSEAIKADDLIRQGRGCFPQGAKLDEVAEKLAGAEGAVRQAVKELVEGGNDAPIGREIAAKAGYSDDHIRGILSQLVKRKQLKKIKPYGYAPCDHTVNTD